MTEAAAAPTKQPRVIVNSLDDPDKQRQGIYAGDVNVYAVLDEQTGNLIQVKEGDTAPEPEPGQVVQEVGPNPKLVLDDGEVVYGCQVWWEFEPTIENEILSIEREINDAQEFIDEAKAAIVKLRESLAQKEAIDNDAPAC